MMVNESQVLKLVRGRRYSPIDAEAMAKKFDVQPDEMAQFTELLQNLKLAGEIVEVKRRQIADPQRVDLMVGTLLCNPRGFGFIRPVRERDGEDQYVTGENMSSALHGDVVVARVARGLREGVQRVRKGSASLPEVKITDVLKRARTEIVGTLREERHFHYVIPDDPRLFRDVVVAESDLGAARPDDKVAVKIATWPSRHINPAGVVTQVFGSRGELDAERLSVAHEYGLRLEFPSPVIEAAEQAATEGVPATFERRQDLTGERIITIDPADARDFDDAVSLRRLNGRWEVGVHIADVSHYIRPDGVIDKEARGRGTSVYLPGQVVPMLPEALSNNICSLVPNEVRMTKTVRMTFDEDGEMLNFDVFRSAIRSVRRYTYHEVQALLEGQPPHGEPPELVKTLEEMHTLAQLLRERRRERGMLELDIPDAHILADDKGRTIGVELRKGDDSHRLIEQYMLAANEAVAQYLLKHNLPYLARTHAEPDPESIQEFRDIARSLGHNVPAPATRKQLQKFLERVSRTPEAAVLSYLLLRSMKPAEYAAEDHPHYAIAAPHYLHFTSPIRRYPDLLAHRILDEYWDGTLKEPERRQYWMEGLPVWTAHSTETERNAESAERSINTRRLLAFVAERQEPMDALITSVENYGMRVQLREFLLNGIIRMSSLTDGYYRVNRKRGALNGPGGKEYRIGQVIQVRVLRYDEFKHQIEFEPARAGRRVRMHREGREGSAAKG